MENSEYPRDFVSCPQTGILKSMQQQLTVEGAGVHLTVKGPGVKAFGIPVVKGVSRGCEAIAGLLYAMTEQGVCPCTHTHTHRDSTQHCHQPFDRDDVMFDRDDV